MSYSGFKEMSSSSGQSPTINVSQVLEGMLYILWFGTLPYSGF